MLYKSIVQVEILVNLVYLFIRNLISVAILRDTDKAVTMIGTFTIYLLLHLITYCTIGKLNITAMNMARRGPQPLDPCSIPLELVGTTCYYNG